MFLRAQEVSLFRQSNGHCDALLTSSYVGYVLKYRSGVLSSLGSPDFQKYRVAVNAVRVKLHCRFACSRLQLAYALILRQLPGLYKHRQRHLCHGWCFSSLLLSDSASDLFVHLALLVTTIMILLVAWGLGLLLTILLKAIMTKICQRNFYAGLYRTVPNRANLSTLALECLVHRSRRRRFGRTNYIIPSGAAILFVGRTDVPFLSNDVSLFGFTFDIVPTNFVKDILVHEAHRHPFMERLLAMYMMKLKNNKFCSDAGACWRQLFVVTLMPWMRKLRVFQ